MASISVLLKPASSFCNMSCDYCFYCDEAQKRENFSYGWMSESTLKNIIRKTLLRADDLIFYAFQGGEPTLRGLDFFKQAVAFQKQYNKKHITVINALQTNGYALDDEWCSFLSANHFLVGLSVDGTEMIHDMYRHDKFGKPTHSRIMQTAERLDRHKVDYNILTVVTSKLALNIEDIYLFYKKQGWSYQQYIPCLDPIGNEHEKNSYSLSPDLYGDFLIRLFELWYKDFQKGTQPTIRTFENYVALALGSVPESCEQRGTCGIQYVVEADGSVYPCDFYMLDPYYIGNFNEDNLDIIDQNRRKLGFVSRSEKISPDCIACRHFTLCRCGCQRSRDLQGNSEKYKNYFCNGYKKFFDACSEKIYGIAQDLVAGK